ncbi:ATP-dependent endonuclease [Psychromonas sp. MME1]|uniref:ATP-dependent nuclease n=1 Tax=Psychromonas sp. MME1 TaxID=3231032 RepID=UPI0034E2DB88
MKIQIKKFKKINDVSVDLEPLNIFIGTNNSGKSSFIQGIQFAVSSCQTLKLKKGNWIKDKTKTLSLDSSEYLYTPTNDIAYLYHGKPLAGARRREDRRWIEFIFNNGVTSTVQISRGKNGGFTTMLTGKKLGDLLSEIEKPYCVYVPGIAGIPILEKYEVPIAVKKSATRGDSNNYLRNILYTISNDSQKWESFKDSVNSIYEKIDIKVEFDEHASEFINVYVISDSVKLPLDSVGTGLLQIVQIFAYIEYFDPKIILLDEPDSHIHPTKQKLLSNELVKRTSENPELKVVFSTHSRYILESLEDKANVVHFQNGNAISGVKGSNILLDIGAADADYLFSKKELKYIIVTEDKVDNVSEKKHFLKKFLIANGLSESEFVLHSYEGCTKVDFAKILQGFVRKQIPGVKVIVHIDRDQKLDTDREVLKLAEDCAKRELLFFMTKYQEVENYFCVPSHLNQIYGVSIEDANAKYSLFIEELKEEAIRKLSNFILRERQELSLNKSNKTDIATVSNLAKEWYEAYSEEFTPGKELLGKTKQYIQNELKKNPNDILNVSDSLRCEKFLSLVTEEST